MTLKQKIYLTLIILSFVNTLRQDDLLGAALSLFFVPMVFMMRPLDKND